MAKKKIAGTIANKGLIRKEMGFAELTQKYPESAEILFGKGMHCVGCPAAMQETIEEGALAHGIDAEKLVRELNEKLNKTKRKK